MGKALVIAFVTLLLAIKAQSESYDWLPIEGVNSAQLASTGWTLVGSSNYRVDESRLLVITFWQAEHGSMARCIDNLIAILQTEELALCEGAVPKNE